MSLKVEVVAVSDKKPKQNYYIYGRFLASIQRFGIEPTILGWNQPWKGLMTKARHYRQFLRDGKTSADVLIVCDAWDIVFNDPPEMVGAMYRSRWDGTVVFNAEKSCFPRGDLADQFPDMGTPWRYLNSGFMIGSPANILKILESMDLDSIPDDHQKPDGAWFNPNDQEHFTLAYLKQPVKMTLDYQCELCQCYSGCEVDEFEWREDRIRNKATGSEPMVHHFNGGSKNNIQPLALMHLSL